jgi:hypothetical protein
VLASNAKLRREIVLSPPEQATAPAWDHAQGVPARLSWARLLKRVFDIDIEHCRTGSNQPRPSLNSVNEAALD